MSAPANEHAPQDFQPEQEQQSSLFTRKRLIAGGVGAAILAAGIGIGSELNGSDDSHKVRATTGTEAPHMLGDTNGDGILTKNELNAMDPADVANVASSQLVGAYGPYFDSSRKATYDTLIGDKDLTSEQAGIIAVPTGPKEAYTDQQVLNQVALDVANASVQTDSMEGERLLPLPFNKDAGGFSDNINIIAKNSGKKLKDVDMNAYIPIGPALPHLRVSFNGVDLSGYAQARIIKQQNLPNAPTKQSFTEYALYGLVKNDGQEEWQLERRWQEDDPSVQVALNNLPLSNSSDHSS